MGIYLDDQALAIVRYYKWNEEIMNAALSNKSLI
jgi:hypothetical protein